MRLHQYTNNNSRKSNISRYVVYLCGCTLNMVGQRVKTVLPLNSHQHSWNLWMFTCSKYGNLKNLKLISYLLANPQSPDGEIIIIIQKKLDRLILGSSHVFQRLDVLGAQMQHIKCHIQIRIPKSVLVDS